MALPFYIPNFFFFLIVGILMQERNGLFWFCFTLIFPVTTGPELPCALCHMYKLKECLWNPFCFLEIGLLSSWGWHGILPGLASNLGGSSCLKLQVYTPLQIFACYLNATCIVFYYWICGCSLCLLYLCGFFVKNKILRYFHNNIFWNIKVKKCS